MRAKSSRLEVFSALPAPASQGGDCSVFARYFLVACAMSEKPKPFVVRLSAEQRDKLEAYRAFIGARSEAETIRAMIDALDVVRRLDPAPIGSEAHKDARDTVNSRAARMVEKAAQQGTQRFETRLKGEWKPK